MDTDRRQKLLILMLLAAGILEINIQRHRALEIAVYRYRIPMQLMSGFAFSLDTLDEGYIQETMWFTRDQIRQLVRHFDIKSVPWRYKINPDPEIALCFTLTRLAFPKRLFELGQRFRRSKAWISSVYSDVIQYIYSRYQGILEWHPRLTYERLREFAIAIHRRLGYPLEAARIWGFVDGTFRAICRPSKEQRRYYSGHKKKHGIKDQGIILPDGTILLYGPVEGRINDWKL